MKKKLKNQLNQENWKKKSNYEKNQLNLLKFSKSQPVRFIFGFINLKQKKLSQTKKTESNQFKPVFVLK